MEKRISFFQFQSVKNVAKAIDPKLKEKATLQKKAIALKQELEAKQAKLQKEIDEKTSKMEQEFKDCQTQIDLLEAGIVQTLGFHVSDLVKKVIEPTGKTDAKTGKALTVTKYIPTDIVSYDEKAKEFVVTINDENEAVAPPTTESTAGSDYDKDAEDLQTNEEVSEREAAEAEAEQFAEDTGDVVTEASEGGENKADDMPW